jgi:hypothetical protein
MWLCVEKVSQTAAATVLWTAFWMGCPLDFGVAVGQALRFANWERQAMRLPYNLEAAIAFQFSTKTD